MNRLLQLPEPIEIDPGPECGKCGEFMDWIECGGCAGSCGEFEVTEESAYLEEEWQRCEMCSGEGGWWTCEPCSRLETDDS